MATILRAQIFLAKLIGQRGLKFFKRPALSYLDLDRDTGIGDFRAQANIGLLLIGYMYFPLYGVGSTLPQPQAVRRPPLHGVFVLKASQGLALPKVVMMKI